MKKTAESTTGKKITIWIRSWEKTSGYIRYFKEKELTAETKLKNKKMAADKKKD